ncbi:unnamed protein product [Microthlaspi erraticum]|uniref:Uncharacterized protein n=1 Tax=Microthlaspi erraticum TaxID=1685480 RepID=A0A6D2HTR6_9BRAS|nr:unnamed protein product [Microthlaspi erraticum]
MNGKYAYILVIPCQLSQTLQLYISNVVLRSLCVETSSFGKPGEIMKQVLKISLDDELMTNMIFTRSADVEILFHVRGLDKADFIKPDWTDPQLICSQKNAASSVESVVEVL